MKAKTEELQADKKQLEASRSAVQVSRLTIMAGKRADNQLVPSRHKGRAESGLVIVTHAVEQEAF